MSSVRLSSFDDTSPTRTATFGLEVEVDLIIVLRVGGPGVFREVTTTGLLDVTLPVPLVVVPFTEELTSVVDK